MKTIDISEYPENTNWEVDVANHVLEDYVIKADKVDDTRKMVAGLIAAAFTGGIGATLGLILSDFTTSNVNKISTGIAAGILLATAVKAYSRKVNRQ